MKRKAFVAWRGEVRAIDVFDTPIEASKAKGGEECWLVITRYRANGFPRHGDEIVRGVKRDRGPDRRAEYY